MKETIEEKKASRPRFKVAKSYGLLVFRDIINADGRGEIQYLIVRPSYGGKTGVENPNPYFIPKGKKNGDETNEEAAIRGVFEETGIRARIVASLDTVRYRNGRKEIVLFLAKLSGGIVCDDGRCLNHAWENDDVRFVPSDEAKKKLRQEFVAAIESADSMLK